ncbi:hypothetical protein GCM10017673_38340 [Streptosporangium violaceochromogenes]|nr:hypothetical protein GCM10017673_38340 [Streptosporangium violaceochromogenes]
MPHPPHNGPLDGHQAARIGMSAACRDMAEYLAAHVPTTSDHGLTPGDWADFAIRVRHMSLEIAFLAYTLERMRNTPDNTIADHLGIPTATVTGDYGHADLSHLADGPAQPVWDILTQTALGPTATAPTPAAAAGELDEWYRSWRQPGEHTAPPARAVTAHL